jgi:hypothetical protein
VERELDSTAGAAVTLTSSAEPVGQRGTEIREACVIGTETGESYLGGGTTLTGGALLECGARRQHDNGIRRQ